MKEKTGFPLRFVLFFCNFAFGTNLLPTKTQKMPMKKMLLICLMLMTVLAVSAQERGYVCTGNNVNIRKGPGTNYAIDGRLDVGEKVLYIPVNSNWVKIYNQYNKEFIGYVARSRIR